MSFSQNSSSGSIDITTLAKEAKQDTGNTSLSSINTNIGAKSDTSATTDAGTFSLIALFKRSLEKLTSGFLILTNGTQKSQLVDLDGHVANVQSLQTSFAGNEYALVTQSIIHGKTTGGGGAYVDVKVNPSGALTVEANIVSSTLPTGASTSALQTTGNSSLSSIDTKLSSQATASNQTTTNNLLTSLDNGIRFKPSALFDAGGRQRVSQITTLGDYKTLNSDEALLLENIGTGTGLFSNNKYNMSVISGQYFIRRSKSYHHYFSGKSQLVELTFDGFQSEANTTKRVGYFSSNAVAPYDTNKDGFWLENTGTTIDLVVSRFGVETLRKNITTWDGYASLSTYDWSKFTVCLFDFLWLGGAILRLFVKTDLGFVLAHTFNYSGTSNDTFTLSPNHSMRYEIRSTTGTGSFRYICAQVATEGSVGESGKQKAIDTGFTDIIYAAVGVEYPVKAIRKKTTHRDSGVKITGAQLFVSSNSDRALMRILLNPTLSAPLTFTDVINSSVQEANGSNTITITGKGTVLFSKYITQNSVFDAKVFEQDFLTWLDMSILNVSDIILVSIIPITATISANAAINYKDY